MTRVRERVSCPTCRAPYAPELVRWRCPVCDTPSPGSESRRPRVWEDADDRLLAIVAAATAANVLLLALLALAVVH